MNKSHVYGTLNLCGVDVKLSSINKSRKTVAAQSHSFRRSTLFAEISQEVTGVNMAARKMHGKQKPFYYFQNFIAKQVDVVVVAFVLVLVCHFLSIKHGESDF